MYCIGVDDKHISIDCVLECSGCNKLLPMWFLIESEGNIFSTAPYVRIIKREHKLSSDIILDNSYDAFSELIDKAECSYRCGFGAGAIVYLRIVLEQIVKNVADKVGISNINNSGRRKSFKDFLKEVDEQCHIVPREFSDNRYQLFSELSNCLHGLCDENISLQKYIPLKRLVKGIIDNIKNNREITSALESLNWNVGVENV